MSNHTTACHTNLTVSTACLSVIFRRAIRKAKTSVAERLEMERGGKQSMTYGIIKEGITIIKRWLSNAID